MSYFTYVQRLSLIFYTLGSACFEFQGVKIFFSLKIYSVTLCPTHHPILWVPRLFPGRKASGSDIKRLPLSSAELKNDCCPTYIHGMYTVNLTHLT
jgi:hypothetical protein